MNSSQLKESHILSLWLGNVRSFNELDEYVMNGFENDFGFEFDQPNSPEIDAHDSLLNVQDLLSNFSFSKEWLNEALISCKNAEWSHAHCAVIFFHICYPETLNKLSRDGGKLTFIGNIHWQTK